MNFLTNVVGSVVVYGIVAILALIVFSNVKELVRRWFFKVEYRCENCNSRFTLLKGKWYGISTGSFYKTRCLRCGTLSTQTYSYYRGMGQSCSLHTFAERWSPASEYRADNRNRTR